MSYFSTRSGCEGLIYHYDKTSSLACGVSGLYPLTRVQLGGYIASGELHPCDPTGKHLPKKPKHKKKIKQPKTELTNWLKCISKDKYVRCLAKNYNNLTEESVWISGYGNTKCWVLIHGWDGVAYFIENGRFFKAKVVVGLDRSGKFYSKDISTEDVSLLQAISRDSIQIEDTLTSQDTDIREDEKVKELIPAEATDGGSWLSFGKALDELTKTDQENTLYPENGEDLLATLNYPLEIGGDASLEEADGLAPEAERVKDFIKEAESRMKEVFNRATIPVKPNTEWSDSHYDFSYELTEKDIEVGEIKIDPMFVSNHWKLGLKDPSCIIYHQLKTLARFGDKNPVEREIVALYKQAKRMAEIYNIDLGENKR
jgi:hypothetical protein